MRELLIITAKMNEIPYLYISYRPDTNDVIYDTSEIIFCFPGAQLLYLIGLYALMLEITVFSCL